MGMNPGRLSSITTYSECGFLRHTEKRIKNYINYKNIIKIFY
jgi:hypothetical protein